MYTYIFKGPDRIDLRPDLPVVVEPEQLIHDAADAVMAALPEQELT